MTKEELKQHCEKQVECCETWARNNGGKPHGKIYEEHKLILDLINELQDKSYELWKESYEEEHLRNIRLEEKIKALEQQPSDDVMAIHTQGLDEGIRCAMCTNSMKSDRGCDGGCRVDEDMYKKVMETINNQMFSQPTSDDCVSRQAVLDEIKSMSNANPSYWNHCDVVDREDLIDGIQSLPPVTPTHRMCKDCTKSKILNGFEGYSIVCSRFGRMAVNPDFYCADFEKGGSENGSN